MKKIIVLIAALFISPAIMAGDNGLITKPSKYSVNKTIDRLEKILKKKGIKVVLRWKHHKKAKKVGIKLRPTELLVFGNPKMGSHFFTSNQTAGIDLPMKALAWKDDKGKVWLTYNDPQYIATRHGITNRDKIKNKMTGALNKFTDFATGKKQKGK